MNISFAPSPSLSSPGDHERHPNESRFQWEAFPCETNYLFQAAENGQLVDIQTDLSSTKNMADILDQNGASALHHAAKMNRVQVINFMIKAGASVDVYSKDGLTPLHVAAR